MGSGGMRKGGSFIVKSIAAWLTILLLISFGSAASSGLKKKPVFTAFLKGENLHRNALMVGPIEIDDDGEYVLWLKNFGVKKLQVIVDGPTSKKIDIKFEGRYKDGSWTFKWKGHVRLGHLKHGRYRLLLIPYGYIYGFIWIQLWPVGWAPPPWWGPPPGWQAPQPPWWCPGSPWPWPWTWGWTCYYLEEYETGRPVTGYPQYQGSSITVISTGDP